MLKRRDIFVMLLELCNVSKSFKEIKAVDDISFAMDVNEIYGFLGPNGAGKTTTIRMICGLVNPDKGIIYVDEKNVAKKSHETNSVVGSIIETPSFYEYMSGADHFILHKTMYGNVDNARIKRILELIGLKDRIKDRVGKYSLGMKQRLALGLCMLHKPKLLILDEPMNGMDPQGIIEFRDILKEYCILENASVLLSSHLLSEVEMLNCKVIILSKGKIAYSGSMHDDTETYIFRFSGTVSQETLLFLGGVDGIEFVNIDNNSIEVTILDNTISYLNSALIQAGFLFDNVERKTKQLENLFIDVTGGNNYV